MATIEISLVINRPLIEGSFVVTAYESNRTYATKNTGGPFPLAIRYTLEPVGSTTQIRFVAEGEPGEAAI